MKNLLFISLILSVLTSTAQIDLEMFKNMSMRSIGPAAMSGRVTSIDVVRDDPSIIYVGTASGGLWKSESMGVSWEPIFDEAPLQSIGAVAISPSNPSVIWAGTGEGNPRNSHSSGGGIYKSLDAGRTWTSMGLEKTMNIHRVIVDPNDENIVYVAAMGSVWGPNEERGVFRSGNGGKSWEKILYVSNETGCADLVIDPSNPNKLVAAMWEFGRKPWTFNSGGEGSGIYITHDGGDTWVERTKENGLPEKPMGRSGLAISSSNPKVLYALVESKKTGLYRSNDGGFNWHLVSTENIGNRPFYYADIFVDPSNENRLFNLYSMVSMSQDGGKNFEVILPYSGVHPDHHAFYIHPDNPKFMIDGNDGGLNISHDGGKNWEFMTTLPLGQFYHINYDMETPYHVYGGMQDNGSWQGPAYVWHYDGIRNEDWKELLFGDGFDVVPNPADPNLVYAQYQGGNVNEVEINTGKTTFIQPIEEDSVNLRFNWNAAIAIDPLDPNGLYYGSQHLHHSTDRGRSWTRLSPDLTTNDTTYQKQALSGGLTIDATQAENYTTIVSIAPSMFSENVFWVGTDDGNVQVTKDAGKNWSNVTPKSKDFPKGAWIPQIEVNLFNEGEAFVVVNDYRRNNWEPYVYHTLDYGDSWKRIVDGSTVDGHCHTIVQDPEAENLLFLGTERGLYFSLDKGKQWQKWTNDYPSVSTIDLKIHPRERDLIIGTFGRAAYILDDIRPLEVLASNPDYLKEEFIAFGGPDAYLSHYRRPDGARFMADHVYEGDNKPYGAMLNVWIDQKLIAQKEEKEKLKITILNEAEDTIRVFTAEPDTGLNRIRWGLDRNGIEWPSRRERDKDADPPGGNNVAPGIYTATIQLGENSTSTKVTVLADPRIPFNEDNWKWNQQISMELDEVVIEATSAYKRIRNAREVLDLIDKNKRLLEEAESDSLTEQMKGLRKELSRLDELYFLPEDFEGYDHVTKFLNNYLWEVRSYIGDYATEPNKNAERALEIAKEKTREVVAEVDLFFNGEWEEFEKEMEAYKFDLFKPLKEE